MQEYGREGYGIYWGLLEVLFNEPSHSYPIAKLKSLAYNFRVDYDYLNGVVIAMLKGGLLASDDNGITFYSKSLNKRISKIIAKNKRLSEAGKKGAEKRR